LGGGFLIDRRRDKCRWRQGSLNETDGMICHMFGHQNPEPEAPECVYACNAPASLPPARVL
jgi:hypothetical protein